MKVAAVGELLIDFASQGTNESGYPVFSANPGGAPGNFLAALAKVGVATTFIGKVGNDAFGKLIVETLKNAGIGTEQIVIADDVFTTLAFVTFDAQGDRSFSFARKPGADTQLKEEEIDPDKLDEVDWLHFGTLSLTDEPSRSTTMKLVEYAKKKGKMISFDPNYRAPLWKSEEAAKEQMRIGLSQTDVVKISDNEVEMLFDCGEQEAAQIMMKQYGVKLVFVTLGPKGCYFANQNGCGYVDALPAKTIDTTGAGDIFGGSAVAQILNIGKRPQDLSQEEMQQIAWYACTAASLSTEKMGGLTSVPAKEEVLKRL